MANVVRFPVQRRARPIMDLLREIAPDVREVLNLAEAFGMEPPAFDLSDRMDGATAEHPRNILGPKAEDRVSSAFMPDRNSGAGSVRA
jgi:hypothetical protein